MSLRGGGTDKFKEHISPRGWGWAWALVRKVPSQDRSVIPEGGQGWAFTKRAARRKMRKARQHLEAEDS